MKSMFAPGRTVIEGALVLALCLFAGCGSHPANGPSGPCTTQTCGLACVDLMTDANNCGACGMACGGGKICQMGLCTVHACKLDAECADSFSCTIDTCKDGACHHEVGPDSGATACPALQFCVLTQGCLRGKACAKSADCDDGMACHANQTCDPAQSICTWEILDKDHDGHAPVVCGGDDCDDANPDRFPGNPEKCDGTDNDCDGQVDVGASCGDPLMACTGGHCGCNPQNLCGGQCVDKARDASNCGACGNACKSPLTCVASMCACAMMCNGVCADLQTDVRNCGACGVACQAGQQCKMSVCQLNPQCVNHIQDVGETDVDCGGPDCSPCDDGGTCLQDRDCLSMGCHGGFCVPMSCGDTVQNFDETDVDCGGSCAPCGTGKGCVDDSDCAKGDGGQAGKCQKNAQGVNWPSGYCTSACRQNQDQQDGSNLDCPGVKTMGENVACVSLLCMSACTSKADCRTNYVCAYRGALEAVCVPKTLSGCDPKANTGCQQGQYCVSYSPDDSYGGCANLCDPFAQDCADFNDGCYAQTNNGKGVCIGSISNNGDGDPCTFQNDCAPGLECFGAKTPVCRPFCGGPKAVACQNGKACVDLSAMVKKAVVGLCGG